MERDTLMRIVIRLLLHAFIPMVLCASIFFPIASAQARSAANAQVDPSISVGSCAVVINSNSAGGLKVRSGPGTSYSIVGYLSDGTIIKINGGPVNSGGYTWWQHDHGGWSAGLYLADSSCGPSAGNIQLSVGLSINPGSPYPGQDTNASFKAKNNGGSAISLGHLGVKCRRTSDQANYDFFWQTNVTIQPGQEYSYSTNRAFDQVAAYSCTPNYEQNGAWNDVKWPDGSTNYVTVNVQNPPPGRLVLTQDLQISNSNPQTNQQIQGSFQVKNDGGQPITLQYLGIQGRLNGDVNGQTADFNWVPNLTLQPGETYNYSSGRGIPTAGSWRLRPNFEMNNSWSDVHHADGSINEVWVNVSAPPPGRIELTSGLVINPSNPIPGQDTSASFTAINNGGQPITLGHLGVKCRRTSDQTMYDFYWYLNETLNPGSSFSYSTNRAFDQVDTYACTPNYELNGAWNDVKWPNGATSYVTVSVQPPPPWNLVLIQDISVSPQNALLNQSVNASYRVKNIGGTPVTIEYLGVQGRLDGQINGTARDFDWIQNFTLNPGDEFGYSTNRTFDIAGRWRLRPNFRVNGQWSDLHRADGSINEIWVNVGSHWISGRVSNPDGSALPGVSISIQGYNLTTDANGYYALGDLVPGVYSIVPSSNGYNFSPASRTVSLPPGAGDQNFVAVGAASQISPGMSSFEYSDYALGVDGYYRANLKVTLRNSNGAAVPGKMISVSSERGGLDQVNQPAQPTDTNGETTASVRFLAAGQATLWAWVVGDGVRLDATVSILVSDLQPVPDVLRWKVNSVAGMANHSLDNMRNDAQAIYMETNYFRGAVGEYSFKIGADLVNGLIDGWSDWSDWSKGDIAKWFAFPGWDSKAWASPTVCKLSNAFLKKFSNGINNEYGQRSIRLILRSGLFYLVAQKNNECLNDLRQDLILDGMSLSNLVMGDLVKRFADSAIAGEIHDAQSQINDTASIVNNSLVPSISTPRLDGYQLDLSARAALLPTYEDRIRDTRWTLESIHQSNESDSLTGDVIQIIARLSAKFLASYFGIAGRELVNSTLTGFDLYMDTKALNESILMSANSHMALVKALPENVAATSNNISQGFSNILFGTAPTTPSGKILAVQHVSQGSGILGLWFEKQSYTLVTIQNTGLFTAQYFVESRYLAETTRLLVPWATLWQNEISAPVSLNPGEITTLRVDYRTVSRGYSPRSARLGIPASSISIDLVATTSNGQFYQAHDYSDWAPTHMTGAHDKLVALDANSPYADAPRIDEMLVTRVHVEAGSPAMVGELWVNNPYDVAAPITVTQPISDNILIIDPMWGKVTPGQIEWQAYAPPRASAFFTYTFSAASNPHATITLPPAQIALSGPSGETISDQAESLPFENPWPKAVTYTLTDFFAPGTSPVVSVNLSNLAGQELSGQITLTLLTPNGDFSWSGSLPVWASANNSQEVSFYLPSDLAIGDYRLIAVLNYFGIEEKIFDQPISIGAPAPVIEMETDPVLVGNTNRSGSVQTFRVHVTSQANIPVTNAWITALIPADTSLVPGSVSDNGYDLSSYVGWYVASMEVGYDHYFSFEVQLPADYVTGAGVRLLETQANLTSSETPQTTSQPLGIAIIAEPRVQFYEPETKVHENIGWAYVWVELTWPAESPVSIDFATHDQTAVSGVNYQGQSGTLTFDTGQQWAYIAVPIYDDGVRIPELSFTIDLTNPNGLPLGFPYESKVTILEGGYYTLFLPKVTK